MNFLDKTADVLSRLDKYTAFLTVKDEDKINPMTIGWAQIGISCGKSVLNVMIRQSRFSKALIDKHSEFTVSVPKDDRYKDALIFCGSKSGRDFDKVSECKLPLVMSDKTDVPGIGGCTVYECRVIYKAEMSDEGTSDSERTKWYKNGDFHTIYTGEILNIKENK